VSQIQDRDENIRLLLSCGDADEIRQGISLVYAELRDPICGWIKRLYPGITTEELDDLWHDTMKEFYEQVMVGQYDGSRKVFSDLCQIIKTDAIDRLRRHETREKILQAIGDELRGTETGRKWKNADPLVRHEILELIRDAGTQLVGKQRIVLELWVANFPESKKLAVLRRLTSEVTGEEETVAAVKGALREAKKKLRQVLARKGYDYTEPGGDYE
jgi:DNA-directed RNA polymerase specialized sigma24 family protein